MDISNPSIEDIKTYAKRVRRTYFVIGVTIFSTIGLAIYGAAVLTLNLIN